MRSLGAFVEAIADAAGKRIGIEELVAVERDAGQEAVVDHTLNHIHVLGIAVEQEHAVIPHGVADRGTRLVS